LPRPVAIVTIAEHIASGYAVTAHCPEGHRAALDLEALAARLGSEHPVSHAALVPRLRCSTCGRRASAITVGWVRPTTS
jgi:hypothetical protein